MSGNDMEFSALASLAEKPMGIRNEPATTTEFSGRGRIPTSRRGLSKSPIHDKMWNDHMPRLHSMLWKRSSFQSVDRGPAYCVGGSLNGFTGLGWVGSLTNGDALGGVLSLKNVHSLPNCSRK